jgi:hypothetical protein
MNLSQNIASSTTNKTNKASKKPINNNSLTSNWMSAFIENYELKNANQTLNKTAQQP